MNKAPHIRIGTQSAFSAETILAPFEYALKNGFDAFEWLPDKKESGAGWQQRDIDAGTRRYIRQAALKHDIDLSVHAPWQLNPADPDFGERFPEIVAFAQDLNASLVNIHLFMDPHIDAYIAGMMPFIQALINAGMTLSIENTPLTGPEDFNSFFTRLGEIAPEAMPQVGMCLDIGHANLCEATRNDYLKFMDLIAPEVPIIHLHVHENYGDVDSHITVFTGPSGKNDRGIRGFVKRMKKRDFSGSIILEQWPDPPELLNQARDRLRALFANALPRPAETREGPAHAFVALIAEANRQHRSWRQRLNWINSVLDNPEHPIDTDLLAYLAIYLRFMGTGELSCQEDGGHYRPSRHARIAKEIFERLSKVQTPENALVIRKIYPWLPSFARAFTRAEPLTRIRDIAHRNDIPKALKKEIKHSLQNKLHRCAGPEDLKTSAALLKKITARGAGYSPAFVKAFKIFHAQLSEFFNAGSLDAQLEAIARMDRIRKGKGKSAQPGDRPDKQPCTAALIEAFLQAKNRRALPEDLIQTYQLLTDLRDRLHGRTDVTESDRAQRLLMADIALEDYAFYLLGQLLNFFQGADKQISWPQALYALELSVHNLRLSQFNTAECQAIASELAAWRQGFEEANPNHCKRLKATLDRCQRLVGFYCDKILSLFVDKAETLGRALAVKDDALRVFGEAEIRSHLVFQISRGLDLLARPLRTMASLPSWDAIVSGKGVGRMVDSLDPEGGAQYPDEPVVLLVEKMMQDGAIPAHVSGIIAAHEIPRLSHLAIRLRLRAVPFAVCEDKNRFVELQGLVGRWVSLDVSVQNVVINALPAPSTQKTGEQAEQVEQVIPGSPVILSSKTLLMPLAQVSLSTGGGKAWGAKELAVLSSKEQADFMTPQGFVIPFGVMEQALATETSRQKSYRKTVGLLNELEGQGLSEALEKLRHIVSTLDVPKELLVMVQKSFGPKERLMVRSSANCEDIDGSLGAGLYDTVGNVLPSDITGAIRQVWASLWNRRAVMARNRAGIAHDQLHMAVLLQPMIVPDMSFVLHTVNPIDVKRRELYMELALGLGQTLASANIAGTPYRLVCNKDTGQVRALAFASFSQAIIANASSGHAKKVIDYSKIALSTNDDIRDNLARRLSAIGTFVEAAMGRPQDIEGIVQGKNIYLVQTRPQRVPGNRL